MARQTDEALLTLGEIADRLRLTGRDRERTVRRCFKRYGISLIRRGARSFLATQQQYAALLEAMECSHSGSEGVSGTSVARSVLVVKRRSSKSTLRDVIAEKMRKPTAPVSNTKPGKDCFVGDTRYVRVL